MSVLTIKFTANTIGIHNFGYRKYNDPDSDPTHFNIQNINVTSIGLQEIIINVPDNLYCASAGVQYTGYVIAACQDQTDGKGDGIPDFATTWTVDLVQQDDPCMEYELECIAVSIGGVTITDDGTGSCTDGIYPVTIAEVTAGDEIEAATINVTVTSGIIVDVDIVDGGAYKQAPTLNVVIAGCTSSPILTPVLANNCDNLNLENYICDGITKLSADDNVDLALNDSVIICADPTTISGLSSDIEASELGRCHCKECKNVEISFPGATSGSGTLIYQTCWDGSGQGGSPTHMICRKIDYNDTISLGCILPNTVTVITGSITGGTLNINETLCT
jgi:hypothetical protein